MEIIPSGRTGKVPDNVGSFQTVICSESSAPITYVFGSRVGEGASPEAATFWDDPDACPWAYSAAGIDSSTTASMVKIHFILKFPSFILKFNSSILLMHPACLDPLLSAFLKSRLNSNRSFMEIIGGAVFKPAKSIFNRPSEIGNLLTTGGRFGLVGAIILSLALFVPNRLLASYFLLKGKT
jgi:hypothetical protein